MRCSQVHRHSSAYLDGDLDTERSSALRGHLRECASCAERLADEQALVRAAADFEPADPPAELWSQISGRLAEEEVADAHRSPSLLRLRGVWSVVRPYRAHVAASLALAMVLALLVTKRGLEQPIALPASPADMQPPTTSDAMVIADFGAAVFAPFATSDETHLEAAMREIHQADERYMTAITELREIAVAESESWNDAQLRRYHDVVADFETRAEELLADSGAVTADSRRRAPLYRHYRKHIEFLEAAVFGQVSQLEEDRR